jgi:carbon-monoxide dehydrogenase small subunit
MNANTSAVRDDRQAVRLHLNGREVEHTTTARTHLGDFVRDHCGLTGTHLGCEHGVCGACTVLVDGKPVRSCITFAVSCAGKAVKTIEGYDDPVMEKLRAAFSQEHALQCGFCTPGMLATAYDIVRRLPDADEHRIRVELSGNLCRCTGYVGIVRAIQSVLAELKTDGAGQARSATVEPAQPNGRLRAFAANQPDLDAPLTSHAEPLASPNQASGAESRKGWSHMEDSFTVDFPRSQVWTFMSDVNALASCLPGAEIIESDGKSVKGKISIKFGPIAAAFNGAATLERDEASQSGIFKGAGTDTVSHSRAKGDIGYRLIELDNGRRTRVDITLDHMLQGPLAQFSRSGLVKDFVSRMIGDFGRNMAARMGGTAAADLPATKINMFQLACSVIWARIKGIVKE